MARVKWSSEAEADLVDYWRHIAKENATAADDWLWRVQMKAEQLAEFPMMGRSRSELGEGLRSIPEYPYLIFYRCMSEIVEIVRVIHGSRDLNEQF